MFIKAVDKISNNKSWLYQNYFNKLKIIKLIKVKIFI